MRKTLITITTAAMLCIGGAAMAEDLEFEVASFYESSSGWCRAVIVTNKPVRVQCAGLDKDKKPLSVSNETRIKPPMDEVMVRNSPEVVTVRCWVVK